MPLESTGNTYGRAAAWLRRHRPDASLRRFGPRYPRAGSVAALRQALAHPLGRPPLSTWLRQAASHSAGLLLVVNDTSRRTPTALVLERLLPRFERWGGAGRLRCLVATGTHAAPSGRARERDGRTIFGRFWPALRQRTVWHDADSSELVPLPSRGKALARFHPWIAGARYVFAIGSCEPHYFAGITGAHKTLTVGVMGRSDIERDHAHALSPRSRPLGLRDNPVHRHQLRLLRALGAGRSLYAVNLLVDGGGGVAAAAAGSVRRSLAALVSEVRSTLGARLPDPADLIVAQVTGPLGASLYQADKGIKNVEVAVRGGGAIVLLAPCPQGVGTAHFLDFLRRHRSLVQVRRKLRRRGYRLGDHKALRLLRLVEGRGIRLYGVCPGLPPEAARAARITLCPDLSSALEAALAATKRRPRVVWVDNAGEFALDRGGVGERS